MVGDLEVPGRVGIVLEEGVVMVLFFVVEVEGAALVVFEVVGLVLVVWVDALVVCVVVVAGSFVMVTGVGGSWGGGGGGLNDDLFCCKTWRGRDVREFQDLA